MPRAIATGTVFTNQADARLGRINYAGMIKNSSGVSFENLRVFQQYAVVYLVGGSGRYTDSRGMDRKVTAGDLIFVYPEIAHAYGPGPGEIWDEFYIVFNGKIFDEWRAAGLLDDRRPVRRIEPIEYWLPKLEETIKAPEHHSAESAWWQVCKLQEVLSEILLRERERAEGSEDRAWLARAFAALDEHGAQRDLEWVAKHLQMSYENFRKKFTRLAGRPPAQYRATKALDRACELLQEPKLGLKEVAERCGFCDEFHFSRRFKQRLGVSPSEFRKRWLAGRT